MMINHHAFLVRALVCGLMMDFPHPKISLGIAFLFFVAA